MSMKTEGRGHAPLPPLFLTTENLFFNDVYLQIILFRSCLVILHGCSSRRNDSILSAVNARLILKRPEVGK